MAFLPPTPNSQHHHHPNLHPPTFTTLTPLLSRNSTIYNHGTSHPHNPPSPRLTSPQAPTAPTATEKRWARIRGDIPSTAPQKTHRPNAATTDAFLSSKLDKRTIRHSTFVSKIQKSAPKPSTTSAKRRRPNKKLAATLEDLADALPDVEAGEEAGKVRQRSLRSRPGALRRKERVVRGEMERFGESMARLVGGGGAEGGLGMGEKEEGKKEANPAGNRWAALRGYISATMEQEPAFAKQGK